LNVPIFLYCIGIRQTLMPSYQYVSSDSAAESSAHRGSPRHGRRFGHWARTHRSVDAVGDCVWGGGRVPGVHMVLGFSWSFAIPGVIQAAGNG